MGRPGSVQSHLIWARIKRGFSIATYYTALNTYEETTILKLNDVLIDTGSTLTPFPTWCRFMIDLGTAVAKHRCAGNRVVVGLVIPLRAYAATFASLGIVSSRALDPTMGASPLEHFNNLKSLPIGHPVTLLRDGRKLKGLFDGVHEEYLRVKYTGGKAGRNGPAIALIEREDSLVVEALSATEIALPTNQRGRAFVQNQDFIKRLIPGIDITDFAGRSKTECAIVGPESALRFEIINTMLALNSGKKTLSASLQDIIRIQGFSGESMAHRAIAVSAQGETAPLISGEIASTVVIFNSALGFKRWQGAYPNHAYIVILDSTESGFKDAAAALNQDYLLSRNTEASPAFIPPPPPRGVEMVSFHTPTR